MSASIGAARIELSINSVEFTAQLKRAEAAVSKFELRLKRAQRSFKRFGRKMERVGSSLTHKLTLPIALVGGASVKMAADFQKSMAEIRTEVGLSEKVVSKWTPMVKNLSKQTGVAATKLGNALKKITSGGLRGAKAFNVLRESAKLSAIDLGDVYNIGTTLVGTMNAYRKSNLKAAKAANIFHKIQRFGLIQTKDFASQMAKVIPFASTLGVSLKELGVNLATITKLGTPFDRATTALRAVLKKIAEPTDKSREALKRLSKEVLGTTVTFDDLQKMIKSKGLMKTLMFLKKITKNNINAWAELFPRVRALQDVLGTVATQGKTYNKVFQKFTDSTNLLNSAFGIMSKTISFKLSVALRKMTNDLIQIGTILFPLVEKILNKIENVLESFDSWSDASKKLAVKIALIAAAIGPTLWIGGKLLRLFASLLTPLKLLGQALFYVGGQALSLAFTGSIFKANAALRLMRIKYLRPLMASLKRLATKILPEATIEVSVFEAAILGLETLGIGAIFAGLGYAAYKFQKHIEKTNEKLKNMNKLSLGNLFKTMDDLRDRIKRLRIAKANPNVKGGWADVLNKKLQKTKQLLEDAQKRAQKLVANKFNMAPVSIRKRNPMASNVIQGALSGGFNMMQASSRRLKQLAQQQSDAEKKRTSKTVEQAKKRAKAVADIILKTRKGLAKKLSTISMKGGMPLGFPDFDSHKAQLVAYRQALIKLNNKGIKPTNKTFQHLKDILFSLSVGVQDIELPTTKLGQGFGDLSLSADELSDKLQKVVDNLKLIPKHSGKAKKGIDKANDSAQRLSTALQTQLNNAFESVGESLGNLFTGDGGAASFFNNLLNTVADFAKQFGEIMIGIGMATLTMETNAWNPFAEIAAGTALIALSVAARNLLNKDPSGSSTSSNIPQLAEGGILTGPSLIVAGDNPNANVDPEVVAPLSKLQNMMGGTREINLSGEFRIKGTDLVLTLEQAKKVYR
jgi:TP901 family phage tail tape measure protein